MTLKIFKKRQKLVLKTPWNYLNRAQKNITNWFIYALVTYNITYNISLITWGLFKHLFRFEI